MRLGLPSLLSRAVLGGALILSVAGAADAADLSGKPVLAGNAALTPDLADTLAPGKFIWRPELATDGDVTIDVDLQRQVALVYRGGTLIGITTVSTGRDGYPTPVGTFPILQKQVTHRSTLYNDAPMPFMQRLTWDGVALHAGSVPGFRSSHGCVHLPDAFAKDLYQVTALGAVVTIDGPDPIVVGSTVTVADAATRSQPAAAAARLPTDIATATP